MHAVGGAFESKQSEACGKGGPVGIWQHMVPVCLVGPQVPVNAPQAEPGVAIVPPTSGHLIAASELLASKQAPASWQHEVVSGAVDVVVELEVLVDVELLLEVLVLELVVVVVEVLEVVVVVGCSAAEIESRQLWTSAWIVGLWPQAPAFAIPDDSLPSHFA